MRNFRSIFLIVFSVFLFSISSVYGQKKVLLVKNPTNNTFMTFKQGERIKVWKNSGEIYRGHFSIKDDSLVISDSITATVALNDVVMLRKNSLGRRILGGTITGVGAVGSIAGAAAIIQLSGATGLTALGLLILIPYEAAAILVTAGGIVLLTTSKRYKAKHWDYIILNKQPHYIMN